MGTVLHPMRSLSASSAEICFSPLLDGDGVASQRRLHLCVEAEVVSVPFSMGTVLHQLSPRRADGFNRVSVPFSMGTVLHRDCRARHLEGLPQFQSPSRWGRCCIEMCNRPDSTSHIVSVPFSMGTVLHQKGFQPCNPILAEFQSPSRW